MYIHIHVIYIYIIVSIYHDQNHDQEHDAKVGEAGMDGRGMGRKYVPS